MTFNGDKAYGINETADQLNWIEEGSKSVSRSLYNAGINVIIVLVLLIYEISN